MGLYGTADTTKYWTVNTGKFTGVVPLSMSCWAYIPPDVGSVSWPFPQAFCQWNTASSLFANGFTFQTAINEVIFVGIADDTNNNYSYEQIAPPGWVNNPGHNSIGWFNIIWTFDDLTGAGGICYTNGTRRTPVLRAGTLGTTTLDTLAIAAGANPATGPTGPVATLATNFLVAEVCCWRGSVTATEATALAQGVNPLDAIKGGPIIAYFPLRSDLCSQGPVSRVAVPTVANLAPSFGPHPPVSPRRRRALYLVAKGAATGAIAATGGAVAGGTAALTGKGAIAATGGAVAGGSAALAGEAVLSTAPPFTGWDTTRLAYANSGLIFSQTGDAWCFNASGAYVRAPHNLLANSATLSTQSITVAADAYALSFAGTGSVALSGAYTGNLAGTGTSNVVTLPFTPTAGTLTLTVTGSVTLAQLERNAAASSIYVAAGAYVPVYGPRLNHDLNTLAPLGLMNEGTSQNVIRNPRAEGGTAGSGISGVLPTNWNDGSNGTAAGLTRQLSYGTLNGNPWIDIRWSGTATSAVALNGNFDSNTQAAAAALSGQTWTSSYYAWLSAGTLTGMTPNIYIGENNSSGGLLATTGVGTPLTSTPTRFSATRTFNNASTAFAGALYQFGVANGATVDFTVRIMLPQVEQSAAPTSTILPAVGSPIATLRSADAFGGAATAAGTAALTGKGAIAASGAGAAAGTAALVGKGALAASGAGAAAGTAALVGKGVLAASGIGAAAGTAVLVGKGVLAASGAGAAAGAAAMAGRGSLAATGGAVAGGSATLTGAGSGAMAASGGAIAGGAAVLTATAGLVASGGAVAGGSVTLFGTAALAGAGAAAAGGIAVLYGVGAIIAAGGALAGGSATLGRAFSGRRVRAYPRAKPSAEAAPADVSIVALPRARNIDADAEEATLA